MLKSPDRAPDAPSMSPLVDELERTRRTRALVEELIADPRRLGPDLQPVRRLDATGPGEVVAWKATGRGQPGTELADTLALLAGAASLGLVERLDWAFRVLVLDTVLAAGTVEPVHLTPEPETFGAACPPRLAVAFGRGRRAVPVAAEVHADAFADPHRLTLALEEYRGWGWQVVLADVGKEMLASPATESLARRLSPDVVQVDLGRAGRRGRCRGDGGRRRHVGAADGGGGPRGHAGPGPGARCTRRDQRAGQRARRWASQLSASG